MCQEVFHLVQRMDLKNIENQLALQCAPVIRGVKISNLLMIESELEGVLRTTLYHTGITYYKLISTRGKTAFLLFNRKEYELYLSRNEIQLFLKKYGYSNYEIGKVLKRFQNRYSLYVEEAVGTFPHEIGVLLGYPIEDVVGFIEHKGKDYLYSGYWKVYDDVEAKKKMFTLYEEVKDEVIQLLHNKYSIRQIIGLYSELDNRLAN